MTRGTVSDLSVLEAAREQAGLSAWQLWLRYFALGGSALASDVARHLRTGDVLSDHEHEVLVHALNERFVEMDLDHPLSYAKDSPS
jgi:hypothetical protein